MFSSKWEYYRDILSPLIPFEVQNHLRNFEMYRTYYRVELTGCKGQLYSSSTNISHEKFQRFISYWDRHNRNCMLKPSVTRNMWKGYEIPSILKENTRLYTLSSWEKVHKSF